MSDVVDFLKVKELNATKVPIRDLASGTYNNVVIGRWKTDKRLGSGDAGVIGSIDLQTSGSAFGECYGSYAEMIPPNGSLSRGALYSLGIGMGAQASSTWGSAGPVAFVKYDSWGAGTIFDTTGFFWNVQGLSEASGSIFSAGGGGLTTAGPLKIKIGSTTYYIMLSNNEAN